MKKRRGKSSFIYSKKKRPATRQKARSVQYILEHGSLQDMKKAKERTQAIVHYHWIYYSELAHQRNQIQDKLKVTLIQTCISNYKFEKWQRAVKYKYGLHPLSAAGSLTFIGQRFNTGSDVNSEVPSFPAIYLASTKDTALQETLGQENSSKNATLTTRELALINPQSEVIVSVSGLLEKVFDLRNSKTVEPFVELITGFKLSDSLKEMAKRLNLSPPDSVQRPKQLLDSLLEADWRKVPTLNDIPANSQIFGHLIYQAGIEGILYPSKLTGEDCLAIFHHNFPFSSSYLQLDDEPPHEKVPRRIDSNNWRICDLSSEEIINHSAS